jgi:predicted deacylase
MPMLRSSEPARRGAWRPGSWPGGDCAGDPLGGPTSRLAAWLWKNLLRPADYYVDCHCGDLPEVLDSFAGIAAGPDGVVSERARSAAGCFDVARVIVDRLEGSTIYQAARAGTIAVLVEVGGRGLWSQAEADVQRHGLLRVAALAGILPAGRHTRPHLPLFEDAADVLTDEGGLWFPEVEPGASVAQGTRLGRWRTPSETRSGRSWLRPTAC